MSEFQKELNPEVLLQRIAHVKKMNGDTMSMPEENILCGRLIVQIAKNMERQVEIDMEKDGLVGSSWMVLIITYSSQEQKVIASDICEALAQNKSTTSRIIESLIEKKFIVRKPDEIDRRKVYLHITQEGKKYVETKLALHNTYHSKIWEGIDVNTLLPQMIKMLENSYKSSL
jgi:DNA-binding MarR family transcriptional regulator